MEGGQSGAPVVVLVCNLGGSLHQKGQQSRYVLCVAAIPDMPTRLPTNPRSLFAAYELTRVGYKNVRVLTGGVNGWTADGRDVYIVDDA